MQEIADLFTFNEQGKIATMRAFWDDQCMKGQLSL